MPTREARLGRAMVALSDNLVDNFDVVDLLHILTDRVVEVLGVSGAGLMLANGDGEMKVIAASSEEMRLMEVFEIQAREGPCIDAFRHGKPSINPDLEELDQGRWPEFAPMAIKSGFHSVHALPMRYRGIIIGALNLFNKDTGPFEHEDILAAQALADIATITVLEHRRTIEITEIHHQLQQALDSRVLIEQAKGKLSERGDIEVEDAFKRMRQYARDHNQLLVEVAQGIINGTVDLVSTAH